MELETQPQPGRATISANEAHRRLGRDRRTIQKMIAAGEIEGGARLGKQRRWYVYLDQIEAPAAAPTQKSPANDLQLEQENARLRTDLIAANAANDLLRAAHAEILEAVAAHRASVDQAVQATNMMGQAVSTSGASWQHLRSALAHYNSALGQYTTPGDLTDLGL